MTTFFQFLLSSIGKRLEYGGVSFWPEVVINDSLLVGFADAFDLIKSNNEHSTSDTKSAKLENVIKNLSETSNPVIMILTP